MIDIATSEAGIYRKTKDLQYMQNKIFVRNRSLLIANDISVFTLSKDTSKHYITTVAFHNNPIK